MKLNRKTRLLEEISVESSFRRKLAVQLRLEEKKIFYRMGNYFHFKMKEKIEQVKEENSGDKDEL